MGCATQGERRGRRITLWLLALTGLVAGAPGPLLAKAGNGPKPTVAVIDVADPYTGVSGLAGLVRTVTKGMAGLGPVEDRTRRLQGGRLDVQGAGVLVVGSFATADLGVRKGLARSDADLRAFMAAGGVVVILAQRASERPAEPWLPEPLRARRGETAVERPRLVQADHPFVRSPNALAEAELAEWRLKAACRGLAAGLCGAEDAFVDVRGFDIVLAAAADGTRPVLALARVGAGAVVLSALPADKIALGGANAKQRGYARSLLSNVLTWAAALRSGLLAPVATAPSQAPGAAADAHDVSVVVYRDRDGNGQQGSDEPGWPGVVVTHGFAHLKSDAEGRVVVRADPTLPQWVQVQAPTGARPSRAFALRDNTADTLRFGLVEGGPSGVGFTVAQVTDLHMGRHDAASDARWLARLSAFLDRMRPVPDVVLATGDLTDHSRAGQFERLTKGLAALQRPIRYLMGNHDKGRGPRWGEEYERFMGPVFQAFDLGGVHFTLTYAADVGTPLDAWTHRDLQLAREVGRPTVLVQHHYPRRSSIRRLIKEGAPLAVVTGHWHGNQVLTFGGEGGPAIVNTSTSLMGGWDFSPPGVMLLRHDGRHFETEYRLLEAEHWLTIVSPDPEGRDRAGAIVATAADGAAGVVSVSYRLKALATAQPAIEGGLTPGGGFVWSAPLPADLPAGRYRLELTATDGANQPWTARRDFVAAGPPPGAPAPAAAPSAAARGRGPSGPRPAGVPSIWTTFRGDGARSGHSRTRLPLPLALSWVRPLGGEALVQSPAYAKGRVYVALADRGRLDTPGARVAAIDAATGVVLWSQPTGASVRHSVALGEGTVVAQLETGTVLALDASTGAVRWRYDLSAESPPAFAFHWMACPPHVHGRDVLVCGHRRPTLLDLATGRARWTLPAVGREDALTQAAAAVQGEWIYRGGLSSGVVAYRRSGAERPSERWRSPVERATVGPVIVSEGVLVQTDGALTLLDRQTGKPRWRVEQPFGPTTAAPLSLGRNLVLAASTSQGLLALEARTGRVRWRLPAPPPLLSFAMNRRGSAVSASPVLVGHTVFTTLDDGRVVALDAATGKIVWQRALGVPLPAGAVPGGGRLFVLDYGGALYAFAPASPSAPSR